MSDKRVSKKTDNEIREMAAGISRDYFDLMHHLRDTRAALTRAEQTLDLIGPNDLPRHVSLDDLVLSIQSSAELIGRRTGTSERERAAQGVPAEAGLGMLAADAVATYAAMLEAIDPDPARRAELRSELARLTTERQGWDETARACVCSPARCTRSQFRDHQGGSPGCMVCADLDPGQPCYAAVIARLAARDEAAISDARVPLESDGLRQVQAYLDQADGGEPETGQ